MRHAILAFAVVLAGCGQEAPTQDSFAPSVGTKIANASARLVIEAKFDEAAQFSDGLAAVRVGGKYGYIDKSGQTVIAPQFDFANPFSEGVAAAGAGAKIGYVDKSGQFIIAPQLDIVDLYSFSEGLAAVR